MIEYGDKPNFSSSVAWYYLFVSYGWECKDTKILIGYM